MNRSQTAAIGINGRFLTQRLTGVQRHAVETVRAMDKLLANRDDEGRPVCELLVPRGHDWSHGPLTAITVRQVGTRQGHLWEQFELPFHIGSQAVLLNLCNTYPLLARRLIVTVHDASIYAVPAGYTFAFVHFYRLLFGILRLRKKVPVLTDSAFSAKELHRYAGLSQARIHIVHCGADHWTHVQADESVLSRLGLEPRRYVLGVASENPNKNTSRLITAFGQLMEPSQRLVLVGGRNSQVFAEAARQDPSWVLRTGQVSDAELAALYRFATCFAFPSLYEGFGLPPLEAMTFGCPVLSSREASLPEVCGDAALYCDGYDEASIAAGLAALIRDSDLRAQLIAAGQQQIARFVWHRTAQQILESVEKCEA